jgi:hypothetical protein
MCKCNAVTTRVRQGLKVFGLFLLLCLGFLFWRTYQAKGRMATVRGEEVYASHDCSDCHLPVHELNQKREKKQVGLIRVRNDLDVLIRFLQTDSRHQSYIMISSEDRENLNAYLKSLQLP